MLALECAMDELAEKLASIRSSCACATSPRMDPTKQVPYSTRHLVPCLRRGAEQFGWDRRGKPGQVRDGRWLVGMGMAAATRQNPLQPSQATVRSTATASRPCAWR